MDNLYVEVEDGTIIWYKSSNKGAPSGDWTEETAPVITVE